MNHLISILTQQIIFEGDLSLFYDSAIYSYTVILNKYSLYKENEELIRILFNSLPMKITSKESIYVTSFISQLLFTHPNAIIKSIPRTNIFKFIAYHVNSKFVNSETNSLLISFTQTNLAQHDTDELTTTEKHVLSSLFE